MSATSVGSTRYVRLLLAVLSESTGPMGCGSATVVDLPGSFKEVGPSFTADDSNRV